MGFANNVLPGHMIHAMIEKGIKDMPFTIAANPSTVPPKKMHHYRFLKLLWRLNLVSIPTIRKCADALQERTIKGK